MSRKILHAAIVIFLSISASAERVTYSKDIEGAEDGTSLIDSFDYLDLTSAEGAKVRAKVLQYDDSSDMAELVRENGIRYKVRASAFSAEDQIMIRSWNTISECMDDSKLTISFTSKTNENVKSTVETEKGYNTEYYPSVDYVIQMKNNTAKPLNNLSLEIIPLVAEQTFVPAKKIDILYKINHSTQYHYIGSIDASSIKEISQIAPGSGRYECRVTRTESRKDSKIVEKLARESWGAWVRVHTTLPDGSKVIIRSMKKPESMWAGVSWDDATKFIDLRNNNTVIDDIGLFIKEVWPWE